MNLLLKDHVIVITGGSAGIGRASAIALGGEGCRLAVGARDASRLNELENELSAASVDVVTRAGDLVDSAALDELVGAAKDSYGRVDGLVACVGSTPLGDFEQLDDAMWQRAFDMKFMATVRAIRAVLPVMLSSGGGRIVILSGNTAQDPVHWMATSSAINSALGSLAGSLARQYGRRGVGINCVSPGPTRTARYQGMRKAVMEREGIPGEEADAYVADQIPDGRLTEPEEVASLVAYLLSPLGRHVNGATFVMDGGQTWPR